MLNETDLKQFKNKYNLDDIEIFTQNISSHKISFTANELKQAEIQDSSGTALRILKNKKIGFTSCRGSTNLDELVKQAIEMSTFSPDIELDFPSAKKSDLDLNNETRNIPKIFNEKGEHIIKTILKEAPTVLVDVSFEGDTISENIINSRDLNYSHSKNLYSTSISIRETDENNFIEIFTAIVEKDIPDETEYVQELLKYYKLCKKPAKIKNGNYPVLFTIRAAKDLLNIIELALNGIQVNEKSSPWHNQLGKQVLSEAITLKQEPGKGPMARSVDDEGNKIQELTLIKDGVLQNFYYDLVSACQSLGPGTPSTGNGFRDSIETQPQTSLLNMILSAGKRSLDEIIKDIKYGLLVDQTMGGLSTNISGDTSVNVDIGFLIENGQLIGRVKDTMLSGNIYNALNNVMELSNNPKWYWSNIYNPDMLLGGFTVTAE